MNIEFEDDKKQKYQSVTASVAFGVPNSYDFNHEAYGATEEEARDSLLSELRSIAEHMHKSFSSILDKQSTTQTITNHRNNIMKNLPSKITPGAIEHILAQSKVDYAVLGGKLTHCMITLPSGFIVTGESSCVDPAEYNKALGEKYEKDRAIQMLYMFEGYTLANELYEQRERANPIVDMAFRHAELAEIVDAVQAQIANGKPETTTDERWDATKKHLKHLTQAMVYLATPLTEERRLTQKEKKDV